MTLPRMLLGVAGGLLGLAVVAAAGLAMFDWNRIKPAINERVSAGLGRSFAIRGNLHLGWRRDTDGERGRAWLPAPAIVAEDIVVANTPWARTPLFASLQRVEFNVALLPLLAGRVQIRRLRLTGPSVNLERLPDGRANWIFNLQEPAGPARWVFAVDEIEFDSSRISYADPTQKADLEVLVDPLGKPVPFAEVIGRSVPGQQAAADDTPHYVFGWKVWGRYKGLPLQGQGAAGGMLALRNAEHPLPIKADIAIGPTKAGVIGTLTSPLELAALDLQLELSGASMADLFPLIGTTLPDTPPYTTRGHLRARLKEPGGARFEYRDFNGKIGASDLRGSLIFTLQSPRPVLTGSLSSDLCRLADLGPLIGVKESEQPRQLERRDKVLPIQAFRTERWRSMDANVELHAKRIVHTPDLPLTDFSTHLVLNGGVLTLDPLRFGFAGGSLQARLRLDGAGEVMSGQTELWVRGFRLKQLFPHVQAMQRALGELNADAALSGRGNSVAALLATADGSVKMLVNDGVVSRGLMEIAGLNVGSYVVTKLFGDEEVPVHCAAADVTLTNGLLTTHLFVFDTENAVVDIKGGADFKDEKIKLDILPHSKGLRVVSLRSPLYVRGSLQNPEMGVQKLPLAARGAAAGLLALIAPGAADTNPCVPMLREMQQTPPVKRSPKPR